MELSKDEIEKIIAYEVEVDCYDEFEVNMGWYIFLSENLNYPFEAEYPFDKKGGKSIWEKVIVTDTESKEEDFDKNEFYVTIEVEGLLIPARLSKLRNIKADDNTLRTLQVWKYSKKY